MRKGGGVSLIWNRMTDRAEVFRKPMTKGEHPLEYDDGLLSTWAAVN